MGKKKISSNLKFNIYLKVKRSSRIPSFGVWRTVNINSNHWRWPFEERSNDPLENCHLRRECTEQWAGAGEYCKMLDSKLALFEGVFKVLDMCREYLGLVVPKVMCTANHSIALLKAVYFLETLAEILLSSRRVLF